MAHNFNSGLGRHTGESEELLGLKSVFKTSQGYTVRACIWRQSAELMGMWSWAREWWVSLHSRQECFSFWIPGGEPHCWDTLQVRALTVLCEGAHLSPSPGNAEAGLWQAQGCPELCTKLKTSLREIFAISKAKKLKRKGFWKKSDNTGNISEFRQYPSPTLPEQGRYEILNHSNEGIKSVQCT